MQCITFNIKEHAIFFIAYTLQSELIVICKEDRIAKEQFSVMPESSK